MELITGKAQEDKERANEKERECTEVLDEEMKSYKNENLPQQAKLVSNELCWQKTPGHEDT